MSTPNFNIQNQVFALDDNQVELFLSSVGGNHHLEQSELVASGRCGSYPVYCLEKFNNAEVLLCGAYYEGATLDYACKSERDIDIDGFMQYDIHNYAQYVDKKVYTLTKKEYIEAIGEYLFDGLDILKEYDFKKVYFSRRSRK